MKIPYFIRYTDVTSLDNTDGLYVENSSGNAEKISVSDFITYLNTSLAPPVAVSNLVFVTQKSDLPTPSAGVITLAAGVTYFFTDEVDLTGDRLVCGQNTTILGGSSENCIGTIKDYTNFIMQDSAFLNSGGMTLDGTIGTVGFTQCLFDNYSATTAIIIASTCTISRRFRIIYSSFVTLSGETSINVSASATISNERYILDTVNFSGGGTYISGVDQTSNKSLFINCVGITNTAVNGQLYMQGNTTATTISNTTDFFKVSGTTTASADNSKYTHSNNRLTNDAAISRKYLIQCVLSFTASANDICEFGFYDSKLAAVRTPSRTKATSNASGRAENVSFSCVVSHILGDYLEIHCRNTSGARNITVDQMNFIITEIK